MFAPSAEQLECDVCHAAGLAPDVMNIHKQEDVDKIQLVLRNLQEAIYRYEVPRVAGMLMEERPRQHALDVGRARLINS